MYKRTILDWYIMTDVEYAFITLPEQFGAAVRSARIEQGISQVQLADKSGCSQRFISQLERGKPTAELGKALQVASCVGLRLRLDSTRTVKETREMIEHTINQIVESAQVKESPRPKLVDYL